MTLTLDRVIRHTVVHHSSTSTYIPNFIGILKTSCGRTDGRTGIWPILLGRLFGVDLKTRLQFKLKCYWPYDLDLWTPKQYHFYGIPRLFPTPSLNTLGSFVFELRWGQTDKQTDRLENPSNALYREWTVNQYYYSCCYYHYNAH